MNVNLLFADRDWEKVTPYYDYKSIQQDLSLPILFRMASREVFWNDLGDEVDHIGDTDAFVQDSFRKILSAPLTTEEEILYRQAVLKDCLAEPEFIKAVYAKTSEILKKWDSLGRKENKRLLNRNSLGGILYEIHVLQLFVTGLSDVRKLFEENKEKCKSAGLRELSDRIADGFPAEREESFRKILQNISFYADNNTTEEKKEPVTMMITVPKIVMECSIDQGLKLTDVVLQEVDTDSKKYRDPNSTISKVQGFFNSRVPDSINFQPETPMFDQLAVMETETVKYIVARAASLLTQFDTFFDQLRLQTAFYIGGINLKNHMKRLELAACFPTVGAQDELCFRELKEVVMSIEQRVRAVGNTCDIRNKTLLIVTGANQGGKSTFLRSIGIAQLMMQSGLQVAAESFQSGIYPSFFTHFTRREDSAMNSGRLDEELSRMSQIVDNLGDRPLILLNESFATTTEKEGSVIAYDIIKALQEHGVKILTVTHLLSFAQKMYGEMTADEEAGRASSVSFLSAEREPSGKRTYKMIQHAPELTSFGLDLYDSIIVKKSETK